MSNSSTGGYNLGCLGLVWLASVFFSLGWLVNQWIERELTGITPPNYWEEWLFFLGLVFGPILFMYLKSKWKK
jgi:hypothetical protein